MSDWPSSKPLIDPFAPAAATIPRKPLPPVSTYGDALKRVAEAAEIDPHHLKFQAPFPDRYPLAKEVLAYIRRLGALRAQAPLDPSTQADWRREFRESYAGMNQELGREPTLRVLSLATRATSADLASDQATKDLLLGELQAIAAGL